MHQLQVLIKIIILLNKLNMISQFNLKIKSMLLVFLKEKYVEIRLTNKFIMEDKVQELIYNHGLKDLNYKVLLLQPQLML